MRKLIIPLLIVLLAAGTVTAHAPSRHQGPKKHEQVDQAFKSIDSYVTDLSNGQKKKLDALSEKTAQKVGAMRNELGQVRDSIRTYMAKPGDQSAVLFPLFTREGDIQTEISKELYRTRLKIDSILTPEQRKELKAKIAAERKSRGGQH